MPKIFPFKAIRPKQDFVDEITGNSSDFSRTADLVKFLEQRPENVLHLTKMHLIHPEYGQRSPEYFKHVEQFASSLHSSDKVIEEEKEALFVYRQYINGIPHTGLLGLVDVLDYQNNTIKRHEHTRTEREKFIAELFNRTQIFAQPVLMGHKHHKGLSSLFKSIIAELTPILDFENSGRKHQVWRIDDSKLITEFQEVIRSKEALYLMDGHHRVSTISRLYNKNKDEAHRYLPAFLLDDEQLQIDPFHRLIEGGGIGEIELLNALEPYFEIRKMVGDMHPPRMKTFCLVTNGEMYELYYKGERDFELDVNLIEEVVLKEIFHIKDSREDQRISFIRGDEGLEEAIDVSKRENAHLFLLYPCKFEQICAVSDRGEVMPPKSTSVEPKGRMGLIMYPYGKQEQNR